MPRPATFDLAAAAAKTAHFTDPVKTYGDLLAGEGRWTDAVARYDDALKSAPD